ncbi:hypothetical protein LSUB1_G006782 [Lachnellula subtilissima]|uniref:PHD-type domain-containing protein n=1 Tax=Lachnellula subtilissima TaxID=602034 RepID=A0A8H8RLB4_9HELO|nr:hypothetical protein LSUB1_G006782 [Lachnellula subtilissima]
MAGNTPPNSYSDSANTEASSANTEYFLRVPNGFTRELTDNHSGVSLQMFLSEKDMKEKLWRGGENFFDGKHDDFCFVCGGTMELFGCQTCESCYHAECMTPSPDPDNLPTFWFCPHCVDNEFHVPPLPSPATYFTPISPPHLGQTPSANIPKVSQPIEKRHLANLTPRSNAHRAANADTEQSREGTKNGRSARPTSGEPSTSARFNALDNMQSRGKPRRTKHSFSPPRKKSKYSALSSDVDKALSLIQRELEKAAQIGRSEGDLEDQIEDLEQRLRIQDGQMLLSSRELELAQKNLAAERRHSETIRSEHAHYKEEVVRLKEAVEKDAELREWRVRLRSMIGDEMS